MSFIFLNSQGNTLSGSDFASLNSALGGGSEIEIKVFNNASEDANAPKIFLQPSRSLGSLD